MLAGDLVRLREMTPADVSEQVRIRSTPQVLARWHSDDVAGDVAEALAEPALHYLVIEDAEGMAVGGIQWAEEGEIDYRRASIDIYLDPMAHGNGYCTDAVRTLARYLIGELGHHRLTIDPAADNAAAIRCYEKVGFRPVGIMRRYERGPDGSYHDGLLMDLLAGELE